MEKSENPAGKQFLSQRLKIFFLIKVIFVTFLLGAVVFLNVKSGEFLTLSLITIYALIVFAYLFNIISGIALKFLKNYQWFLYLQIIVDTLFVTAIVYFTGGSNSVMVFLYLFVILAGGYLNFRRGALLASALSAILYGALLDLEFYRVLPYFYLFPADNPVTKSEQVLSMIIYNLIGFFAAGFLWGIVTEQLNKTGRMLEEKQADLKNLESLTRMVFQNIPSGIVTVGQDGRITLFNRSAEAITGYSISEVLGMRFNDIFSGLQIENVKSLRNETGFKRKDGKDLILGYSASLLGSKDGMVIFQDLTREKQMETEVKRSERLAALGRMSAGLAHEVRNIVASITGSAQLLASLRADEEEKSRLTIIMLNESKRLNGLVANFLNFAKPERVFSEIFSILQVVNEVVELFQNNVSNNIKMLVVPETVNDRIRGSMEGFRQVIHNLLLNAVDAVGNGGEIKIEVMDSDENKKLLKLIVSDTGCGIPEDVLPHIFEPFFTTKTKGAGLGLATVFRIVEAHSGKIEVESKKGAGTKFTILLPGSP